MGFWIFMLIMDLLLPFTMIFYEKGSQGNKFIIWIPDFDVYEEQRYMGICS